MKLLHKIMSLTLVLAMTASIGTTVFASDKNSENIPIDDYLDSVKEEFSDELGEKTLTDIIAGYREADEFRSYYNSETLKAQKMIDDAVNQHVYLKDRPTPRRVYQTPYAKPFVQNNGWYCGPAALLQARVANGIWSTNISSSESYRLQEDFGSMLNTNSSSGTQQSLLPGTMNMSYFQAFPYTQLWVSANASNSTITPLINESIRQGYAPIANVKTQHLKYYGGHVSGHFITLYRADSSKGVYGILDSNNNSNYFGFKSATANELCNAMRASNGSSTLTYGI